MSDTYDAVMAGCRLLLDRMNISKGELAQFLRAVARILELEESEHVEADAIMADIPAIVPKTPAATGSPCEKKGCPGHMRYVKDEYGSLSDGGSYEIWDCTVCGHRIYDQLPD